MRKSDILKSCFGAVTFVVVLQFSQNNVFIELANGRSAFWHRDLKSWTLISKDTAYKTFLSFVFVWQYLGVWHFSDPYLVGNLPLWFKIIHPGHY